VTGILDGTFADPQLERSVRAGLDAVEAGLRDAVEAKDPFLADAARHLLYAGG
jgi:heptaprenyl diphosphate synthase